MTAPYRLRQYTAAEVRRWHHAWDDEIGQEAFAARFGISVPAARRIAAEMGMPWTAPVRPAQNTACACGARCTRGKRQCLACYRRSRPELFSPRAPVRRQRD